MNTEQQLRVGSDKLNNEMASLNQHIEILRRDHRKELDSLV
jgi:hypothetical protein